MKFDTVALGDYIQVVGGFAFKSEHFADRGIPVVRISDIQDDLVSVDKAARIPTEIVGKGGKYNVQPGDILIAMSGATTGKIGVVPINCIQPILQNQRVGNFKIKDLNKINKAYLKHYLVSSNYQSAIWQAMVGVAQPNISSKQLEEIKIPLPPIAQQKRIAAILDQAEALRSHRREAIGLLNELGRSVFLEMFGDPVRNPKMNKTVQLMDITTRVTDGTHQPPKWAPDGIPFLFVSNITNGQIDFQTSKFISDATHAELTKRCPIEIGDVLYTTVGSYGNAALVSTDRKFSFQRHIAHIKPDASKINSLFLAEMLQSPGVRQQVDKVARGVAQKTVNLADLKKLIVFQPPLPLQQQFAQRIAAIEALKATHREALTQLDALFASLQHRAFRGEL
jgi:type I restriction enzyme, S subunit